MKIPLLTVVWFSVFSLPGCEEIFKDSGKLADDIYVVEDDVKKLKEDL